jgi:hypothetical protein
MRSILAALGVLTLAFLAGGISVRAGDVTYNMVNDPVDQNGYTLSGTIVTDGTIGELNTGNIVSWQFTFTGPGGTFSNSGSRPASGDIILGLGATTSGDLILGGVVHFLGKVFDSPEISWEPVNHRYFGFNAGSPLWDATPPTGFPEGVWTIATAASVPEPSSVVLAGLGCASAIAFVLARKRSDYRRHANTTK